MEEFFIKEKNVCCFGDDVFYFVMDIEECGKVFYVYKFFWYLYRVSC